LETMGITSVKIFTEGRLLVDVETSKHPRGEIHWKYHVAPAVLTYSGGAYRVMVIDPSLFDRPVPAQEWVNIQTADPDDPPEVSYWPRFTYHNESSFEERWLPSELRGADDHLRKFLMIADDPVAIENFREFSRTWHKGQPWALDPGIFETLFIRK
ncbi:MAG TPA: protein-glutamine glutaminase family protein, partial [Bdellovibrionales bacterium]|nr:protein-glutamine glutaminase family protein [Bdellovibrionales bacterium]